MLRSRLRDILQAPLSPGKEPSPSDTIPGWHETLTQREIQVLKLISAGNSTKQVAAILGIAFKTSVGHRARLMKKLDIHDTASLVRYAIRAGISAV